MCTYCVEIQQGRYKTLKEFEDQFNLSNIDLDLDHYFTELGPLIEGLQRRLPELPSDCTCGAKHTSFPNKHLKYCDES